MIERRAKWLRDANELGSTQLLLAHSYWQRLRGLLGRAPPRAGQALEIKPCASVHTFFMGYAIDVVFLDRNHHIVKLVPRLMPWRVAGAAKAALVIEFAAGGIEALGLQVGDQCVYC